MKTLKSTTPEQVTVAEIVVIDAGEAFGAWARMSNGARRYFSGSKPTRYLAVKETESRIKEAAAATA